MPDLNKKEETIKNKMQDSGWDFVSTTSHFNKTINGYLLRVQIDVNKSHDFYNGVTHDDSHDFAVLNITTKEQKIMDRRQDLKDGMKIQLGFGNYSPSINIGEKSVTFVFSLIPTHFKSWLADENSSNCIKMKGIRDLSTYINEILKSFIETLEQHVELYGNVSIDNPS